MSGHGRVTIKREEEVEEEKKEDDNTVLCNDHQQILLLSSQQHSLSKGPPPNGFATRTMSANSFEPLQNARRARFPPGCHVLVHPPQPQPHHSPPMVCGIVTAVGVLNPKEDATPKNDEANAEPEYYYDVSIQNRSFLVTEENLEFAPGTPVTIRRKTKFSPPAVVLLGPVLAAAGLEPNGYSVQELDNSAYTGANGQRGRIHNNVAPGKLRYRYLWDNMKSIKEEGSDNCIEEEGNDNKEVPDNVETSKFQPLNRRMQVRTKTPSTNSKNTRASNHESAVTNKGHHQASTVAVNEEPTIPIVSQEQDHQAMTAVAKGASESDPIQTPPAWQSSVACPSNYNPSITSQTVVPEDEIWKVASNLCSLKESCYPKLPNKCTAPIVREEAEIPECKNASTRSLDAKLLPTCAVKPAGNYTKLRRDTLPKRGRSKCHPKWAVINHSQKMASMVPLKKVKPSKKIFWTRRAMIYHIFAYPTSAKRKQRYKNLNRLLRIPYRELLSFFLEEFPDIRENFTYDDDRGRFLPVKQENKSTGTHC